MPQGKMSSSLKRSPPPPGNRPYVSNIPKPISTSIPIPIPSQRPSLFRTMAEGFAFGTGSSVAREAIHNTPNIFSGSSANTTSSDSVSEKPKSECEKWEKMFEKCIEKEQSYCIDLFEKMEKSCSFQK
jgi:hypothetical protein